VRCRLPSFAKLNLDLRVLHKRPDGFHEVRTIFQTISLADRIEIEFERAKRTQIDLTSSIDIRDNLVVRSAKMVLEHLRIHAWVRFVLDKRIPMGAGLGGGSSNAAAVLLALPALAGKPLPADVEVRFAEMLGSDVPFFLKGGTAVGIGRGTELYPLADQPAHHGLVVFTGVHVSTAEAYQALGHTVTTALTSPGESPILREFQTIAGSFEGSRLEQLPLKNDFEVAVFKTHPELAVVVRKLRKLGAQPALMTGSGSALFGIFPNAGAVSRATAAFPPESVYPFRFVSRRRYQSAWRRALGPAAQASSFASSRSHGRS
jgi:4-diphosphocytidyl-2-C-methyl-D-erythritol kinase